MAVQVEFYSYAKRINSTKTPNHTSDVFMTESCVFKEPCDVVRPSLRLKIAASMVSPDFLNMAYIPSFTRYYFINAWRVISNDIWECDLVEDFLASWKMGIGIAQKYVLRSASNYDDTLIDSYYPAKVTHYQLEQNMGATFSSANATYVLGIIGGGTTAASMGAVQYYAFTQANLVAFFNSLFDGSATWLNISTADLSVEMQKAFINPFQYVSSAMLFPFDVTTGTGATAVTSVKFGWWEITADAYMLPKAPSKLLSSGLQNIPKHPQAAARGAYLNSEPYSQYIAYIPGTGYNKIDAGALQGANQVAFTTDVDLISGQSKTTISPYDSTTQQYLRDLTPLYGQCGVPIELAQIGRGGLEGVLRMVGNTYAEAIGSIGGPISNAVSGILSAVTAATQTVQSKGANGSLLDYLYPNYYSYLYLWYYNVADSDIAEKGAPCCKTLTLGNLTGFIMCEDGELNINGLLEEKQALRSYLTGGFYYE